MPPPKLMKKHRTFDCDLLANMEQRQQNHLLSNDDRRTDPTTSSVAPIATLDCDDDDNNDIDNQTDNKNITNDDNANDTTITACQNRNPNHNLNQFDYEYKTTTTTNQLDQNNALNTHGDRLSKLVLSSSLHQLADSKYHTNNTTNNTTKISESMQTRELILNANTMDINASMQRGAGGIVPLAEQNKTTQNSNFDIQHHLINDNSTEIRNANSNQTTNSKNIANNKHDNKTTTKSFDAKHHNNAYSNTKNLSKTKQREANLDTVHVVVGNETCDLDSAVSCLLMFHIISKMSDEINGKDKTRTLYIPLLNTTRDMLDSKSEVLWFLQKTLNIDKSFLTCKDDIDWNEIKKNGVEVLITLVDHNYNEEFKDIGKVVEIIDHHQVQNPQWLMENQSIRLTLDTSVGSCTTLVAERLFYIYAEHHVSDEILLLIYGTVLLDTICLSENATRFTRRDVYLLKKLDSLLGSKKPVRDELYKQLVEIKNSTNIRELNFEKLMKRDLKIYKDKNGMRIGIASLFGLFAREALGLAANIDLDSFFRQNQYEAFIIMGVIPDVDHSDSMSRDLVLISANSRLFDRLCQVFEQDTSKLDLQPIGSNSSPDPEDNIINNKRIVDRSIDLSETDGLLGQPQPLYKARIWLQRNVTSSRKVVAPLVLKVLHDGVQ